MGQNVVLTAKDSTAVLSNDSGKAKASEVYSTSNAINTYLASLIAGERNAGGANDYLAANHEASYALSVDADTNISSSLPATLYAVRVVVATTTETIVIRDSTAAGAGNIVLTIPAGTAINTRYDMDAILMTTGIYADYTATATGTLIFAYRPT